MIPATQVQNRRVHINGSHHAGAKSAKKDTDGSIQASKERVAHYIKRGFSQRDTEAEALLDARLAQPYVPPTK